MKTTWTVSRLLILLAVALPVGGSGALAQELTPPPAPLNAGDIDAIFAWATPDCPGCAVAVSLRGDLIVNRAYGSADLDGDVPITTATIFDAGSLQKQFVAAAALLLIEDGRLSLAEDIREYIPELPDYGHRITVDHLLTHTSGIRDWTAILPLTAGEDDALTVILRQRGLNFAPGEEWAYSNSGYVLAREIVARRSGMSFADFARTRLFEPLGMKSTVFCADIRAVPGERAMAYDKSGDTWTPAMMLDRERGGGGVFSTPADLIIWSNALANNLLGASVSQKLQEPTRLSNGRTLDYCRGLILDSYRGLTEVWHTGSADGYKSFLGNYPEHDLSIAIMCNSGDGTDRTAFAHRIVDLILPGPGAEDPESGPPPAIPQESVADVTTRTGLFMSERTGEPLRLALDRGRLRVAGGPGLVLVTPERFRRWGAATQFMSGDAFELHFLSLDQFELKSMEGATTRYRRAEPFNPTPEELQDFAGRFSSEEIGAVFQVEPQEAGLVMRLEHAPVNALAFQPIDRDTFQFSRVTIRFQRDDAGKVIGFDFSNPLVRNIRCARADAK